MSLPLFCYLFCAMIVSFSTTLLIRVLFVIILFFTAAYLLLGHSFRKWSRQLSKLCEINA